MRLVDIGHARLAIDDEGRPAAPAVVLLHSSNRDRRMWRAHATALSREHRVISVDARGYGESSLADEPYRGTEDVAALVRALGIPKAALVGASFGGRVALDTAIAQPDIVSGVVLIGARPSGAPAPLLPHEQHLVDAADEAEREGDRFRRAELDIDMWTVGPTRRRADVEPAFLADAVAIAHAHVGLLKERPNAMCLPHDPPAAGLLHSVDASVLSIVGSHDFAFVREAQRTMTRTLPHIEAAVIEGAAHFPSLEQPAAVLRLLSAWLTTHGS